MNMNAITQAWPSQGCGVSFQKKHTPRILSEWPMMDWLEAATEDFMDTGGRLLDVLTQIRQRYPVALHGVSLSIGSCDPLDKDYLKKLKELTDRIEPFVVSDHLCWTGVDGENLHDLLPLPFTQETMKHVTSRVNEVQDFLGRPILLENVSAYVTYKHSQVPEWDFLREVARRSGCGILLDLNNIYVNAANHGFDAFRYLEALPPSMVGQFRAPVVPDAWKLYEKALRLYGPVSTLIEWNEDIPDFTRLLEEVVPVKLIYEKSRKDKPIEVPPVPLYFPESPTAEKLSLLNAQRCFKGRIKAKQSFNGSAQPFHEQNGDPAVTLWADETGPGVVVYAEGYVARLSEALAEVYETVRHLLDKEAFVELTKLYLQHFPSHHYNINRIGKNLPGFIGTTRFSEQFPFLPDLATFELAVDSAFHAFDQAPFDPAVLATLTEEDWEKMRVVFQPSVNVVGSEWPILDIWNARKTPFSEMNIELAGRSQNILVYRKGFDVCCEVIEKEQKELVQHLQEGGALGKVCMDLAEATHSEELPLERWFSLWTEQGIIASVAL